MNMLVPNWHCKQVYAPKYRFRALEGLIFPLLKGDIQVTSAWKWVHVVKLNIQKDHVHMIYKIPPKILVWEYYGLLKGKFVINVQNLSKLEGETL